MIALFMFSPWKVGWNVISNSAAAGVFPLVFVFHPGKQLFSLELSPFLACGLDRSRAKRGSIRARQKRKRVSQLSR
jgi:hypothetical protein